MNDGNNKTPRKIEETSKSVVGSSSAVRPSGFKKLLSKRWVFPAAYMAAAAIIVAILWVYSGTGKDDATETSTGLTEEIGTDATNGPSSSNAAPVAANSEKLQWPVNKIDDMATALPYFDASASLEDREAAMVEYPTGTFKPHTAVDLARKDGKPFDVLAALSGEVTVAEQTPNNYEVTIKHADGLVTVYQSLADVQVKVGDKVEQGDLIGTAGQSESEPNEGYHVHFEVRNNDQSVNPNSLIGNAKK